METPNKEQLIQDLEKGFDNVISWINNQPANHFNQDIVPGKWTIAGHLYHLIKSTKAVSLGMVMPKAQLEEMFGKSNRNERTYDELYEKYKTTISDVNFKAPNPYEAEPGREFEQTSLIERFEGELQDFIKAIELWEEAEMSEYILPHSAIGKCTIREFVYFTILHTKHHLDSLKGQYELS